MSKFVLLFLLTTLAAGLLHGAADETVFANLERTLQAAPVQAGNGDGSSVANAMELQAAINAAGTTATRIVLGDGRYAAYYTIGSGSAALVLEAANPGLAVITGSERITTWNGPDANGVYWMGWTSNWGTTKQTAGPTSDRVAYNQRREMVFLDGQRLVQRVDAANANLGVASAALAAGQFTVDEAADRLYLKPPSGKNPTSAVTEVAMRGAIAGASALYEESRSLLTAIRHARLSFKGLVFKHCANSPQHNAALQIHNGGTTMAAQWLPDILIEDCTFTENNGVGVSINGCQGVTVRRCRANDNGEKGLTGGQMRSVLIEDSEFNRNNWRYGLWMAGWDAAGIKFFDGAVSDGWFGERSSDITYRRCRFIGNQAQGLWQDYFATTATVDSCLFADNLGNGIMQEVTPGPLLITNTVIKRCGQWPSNAGILVVNSPDVTLDGCTMFDSGSIMDQYASAFMHASDDRKADNVTVYRTIRTTIRNSTLMANRERTNIFWESLWVSPSALGYSPHAEFAKTLTTDYNHYFRADAPGLYLRDVGTVAFFSTTVYGDWRDNAPDTRWDDWLLLTYQGAGIRQDQHSTWGLVDLAQLDGLDPTVRGDADGNGRIEVADLTVVRGQFGRNGAAITPRTADLDSNGRVDAVDLSLVTRALAP